MTTDGSESSGGRKRKIYSAAITFAVLAVIVYLRVDISPADVVGRQWALVFAAPFGGMALVAAVIRHFSESELTSWGFTLVALAFLLVALKILFDACVIIPGLWVC